MKGSKYLYLIGLIVSVSLLLGWQGIGESLVGIGYLTHSQGSFSRFYIIGTVNFGLFSIYFGYKLLSVLSEKKKAVSSP